jgi:hypothetical protein
MPTLLQLAIGKKKRHFRAWQTLQHTAGFGKKKKKKKDDEWVRSWESANESRFGISNSFKQ